MVIESPVHILRIFSHVAFASQATCVLFLPNNQISAFSRENIISAKFPIVVSHPVFFSIHQFKNLQKYLLLYKSTNIFFQNGVLRQENGEEVTTDVGYEIIPLDHPIIERMRLSDQDHSHSDLEISLPILTVMLKEKRMKHDWILKTEEKKMIANSGEEFIFSEGFISENTNLTFSIPSFIFAMIKKIKPDTISFSKLQTFSKITARKNGQCILKVHFNNKLLQEE